MVQITQNHTNHHFDVDKNSDLKLKKVKFSLFIYYISSSSSSLLLPFNQVLYLTNHSWFSKHLPVSCCFDFCNCTLVPQFGCLPNPSCFQCDHLPICITCTNLYLLPDKSLQIKWHLGQWLLFFKTRIRYSSCLIGRSMLFSATTSSSIATAASSTTAAASTTNGRWWYYMYNFIFRRIAYFNIGQNQHRPSNH